MSHKIKLAILALTLLCTMGLSSKDRSETVGKISPWRHLAERLITSGSDSLPIRILHIGDSHVRSRGFSMGIDSSLASVYRGRYTLESSGINGSTYQTWLSETNIKKIVTAKPDLLIVSLGTNDSYSRRFDPSTMSSNMEAFYAEVRKHLPQVGIVCTTPPASYLRQSRRIARKTTKGNRKRRSAYRYNTSYHFNDQTQSARKLIMSMSKTLEIECIDLNSYIGTEHEASRWLKQGLMHSDHVHYTVPGYTRHGQWVGQELIKLIKSKSEDQ